jgi:hypothetical protein
MTAKRIINQISENKKIMSEIKEHIYDCGIAEMEEINSYSNLHIAKCMENDYAGGIEQFIIDSELAEYL